MPEKPPLQKPAPGQKPKTKANGCLMAFVITLVVTIAVVVFGGYFAVMHSSWPLKFFAKMINESGEAEIKGLEGSLSSGFSADEFRIFETGLTDTYFTNISFKYNGVSDLSGNQRLIVEEFVIGKAFISLPEMDEEDSSGDIHFDSSEFEDLQGAEELEETGSFEIKAFRIDEFVIQNPDGEEKSGSVLISGFKADHSDLKIGELKVTGDFLEMNLETLPETNQFRQAIKGVVKSAIHKTIRKDIDFSLEFGGEGNAKQATFTMFEGKVRGRQNHDSTELSYDGITLADYVDPSWMAFPDDVTMKTVSSSDEKTVEISAGSLRIGRTKFSFEAQTLEKRNRDKNELVASAEIGDRTIALRIPDFEDNDRIRYKFSSEGMDQSDIVAQVLFGKAAADLNDQEREQMAEFSARHISPDDESDPPTPVPPPVESPDTNAPAKKE